MRLFLTAALFLFGLFNLFVGLSFLLTPAAMGAQFNLAPNGSGGLAVLRADFTAFFVVTGACQLWGGWKRNGDLLLVPILLMGLAFTGRALSVMVDGSYAGFAMPMAVEAVQVALGLAAWRLLPHHRIAELAN
jgi:hypothetical protein